jgi:hypothetical protein
MGETFDAREIFGDVDVQRITDVSGGGSRMKLEDLESPDRDLVIGFLEADGEAESAKTPEAIISALVAGVRAFESLSDPMPRSWSHGWKKFVLYITALNSQFLWDRHHRASETAIFADWVVFSIGHYGWGPDGNSTPLGKQHSYCMAVAAEAGGGIQVNPATGLFQAPDGSAARNYRPVTEARTPPEPGRAAPRTSPTAPKTSPAAPKTSPNDYFADAGITGQSEKDRYSRYIEAAVAQGSLRADEIVGVGEGPSHGIYVVDHRAVTLVTESGMFKKRIEARRIGPTASIMKLSAVDIPPSPASIKFEGRDWTTVKIVGLNSTGQTALEIVWGSGSDSQNLRQREHLLKVIDDARNRTGPV